MRSAIGLLLVIGVVFGAQADTQIKFRDANGTISTMFSNGDRVRINRTQAPGYVMYDSSVGFFYLVDDQRGEIARISADEIRGVPADGALNVSLRPRGSGEKIAGYRTGRFDLISNGLYCGMLNGSSRLIENRELKRMLEGMQNLHKLNRGQLDNPAELSECEYASSQLSSLVATGGFVMRFMDDKGKLIFEVLSVDTAATTAKDYYTLPDDMPVVDLNQ